MNVALLRLRGLNRVARVGGTRGLATPPPRGTHNATTSDLKFFNSVLPDGERIPMYRVLDGTGKLVEGAELPEVCSLVVPSMPVPNPEAARRNPGTPNV
jgi:hypothetical protein